MRVLLIQENGRHAANRNFRECLCFRRAFHKLGHDAVVWGLGHSNFQAQPHFNDFDIILNLENYDEQGWLPNLKLTRKPVKFLWAVDEHARGLSYYQRAFEQGYDFWLHATRDFVQPRANHIWFPNCADPTLLTPRSVSKRADIGFCGNVCNRAPWFELLKRNFCFVSDIFVIGDAMVDAINSYTLAFNRNIANDINARNFEVLACNVPLVTSYDPQYFDLGFQGDSNCIFYSDESELIEKCRLLLKNSSKRQEIAENGRTLLTSHTYEKRALRLLELAGASPVQNHPLQPLVSVCVISNSALPDQHHRRAYLKRLLKSLQLSGIPRDRVEVLIAGAIDTNELGQPCTFIDKPDLAKSGEVSKLRNELIRNAKGEWVIHCDDDILFTPGYWEAVQPLLTARADIICTRLLNPNGTRYWDWAAFHPGLGQTLLPYDVVDPFVYATGGHALYRRSIFEKIRWNEQCRHGQNEEHVFAAHARSLGLHYAFCKDATVFLQYHHCDAAAVISQTPQREDAPCTEFLSALRATDKPADSAQTKTVSISILVCCYRYLNRFKIFVDSLRRQEFDGAFELVVANPNSPDGLSTYLNSLDCSSPRIVEVLVERKHFRNRGYLIQKAFEKSHGDIVIGMDCDLVLPPDFLTRVQAAVLSGDNIFGVYRNFLSAQTTEIILQGKVDPVERFTDLVQEDLQEEEGYRGILGYCQAARRHAWEKFGYPTEFDSIAQSDVEFVKRLAAIGITPALIPDLRVLHLHHPRDWSGTKQDL